MFSSFSKTIFYSILIVVFLLIGFNIFAQENLEQICEWGKIENKPSNLSDQEYEDLLKKCQEYYQDVSEEIEKDINKTKGEKDTLQNKIYILRNTIKNLNSQIYQGNIMIKDLGSQIYTTQLSIDQTNLQIDEIKNNLSNILQMQYENDQQSPTVILLENETFTDFLNELMELERLSLRTRELLENIKNLKISLENQKDLMDGEQNDLKNVVKIQTIKKQENTQTKKEQEGVLKMTEAEYQKHLSDKQEAERKVAEITTRIFELAGIPEAPTFGEALELAKYVENILGIRPAFLLAIFKQESNIGKNVGQCYLRNTSTGAGVVIYNGKQVDRVMKPSRDVQPFLSITKELGRDWQNTRVSCPMSIGYGGAMGPGQFIPSTWIGYRDRVKAITGKPADPWNIRDAFIATGLYVSDYGAKKQTYDGEWKAAMIYFSGTSKRTKYNYYGFYGDSVMAIAKQLQKDIDIIEAAR
jgi:membrane-bound lytic murein transglycosylase B